MIFASRLVEFKTKEDAERALDTLNDTELDGRKITLKKVKIGHLHHLLMNTKILMSTVAY